MELLASRVSTRIRRAPPARCSWQRPAIAIALCTSVGFLWRLAHPTLVHRTATMSAGNHWREPIVRSALAREFPVHCPGKQYPWLMHSLLERPHFFAWTLNDDDQSKNVVVRLACSTTDLKRLTLLYGRGSLLSYDPQFADFDLDGAVECEIAFGDYRWKYPSQIWTAVVRVTDVHWEALACIRSFCADNSGAQVHPSLFWMPVAGESRRSPEIAETRYVNRKQEWNRRCHLKWNNRGGLDIAHADLPPNWQLWLPPDGVPVRLPLDAPIDDFFRSVLPPLSPSSAPAQ